MRDKRQSPVGIFVQMSLLGRIQDPVGVFGSATATNVLKAPGFRLPYHLVRPIVFAVDMIGIITASVASGVLYHWLFLGYIPPAERYLGLGMLAFANISALLAARGDYGVSNLLNFRRQARDLVVIWTGVLFVLLGVAFSLKIEQVLSRGATLTFFAFGLIGMLMWRQLVARFLQFALSAGVFADRRIILIAEHNRITASPLIAELERRGYKSIYTIELSLPEATSDRVLPSLRDALEGAIEAARTNPVEEILLLLGWSRSIIIDSIVQNLSVLPTPIHLLPDDNVARYLNRRTIDLGTTWGAEVKRAPLTTIERLVKRCFDIVGACFALLLLSPLMLLTALLIKLDSSGPILFFQTRNGFNGRRFRIAKFRTMHVLEDGPEIRQARRDDPRVTRLGRWLRRTNIDELPQLFNVIHGDMSLVGPRPHAAAHNTEYEKLVANYAFRHHVKPGITGWAQVNGYRGETKTIGVMAKRVELDLWYVSNWNLWLDIRILLRTLVLGLQSGGY